MNPRLAIPMKSTPAGALSVNVATAGRRLPGGVGLILGTAAQPSGWIRKTALAVVLLIAAPGQAALATSSLLPVDSAALILMAKDFSATIAAFASVALLMLG